MSLLLAAKAADAFVSTNTAVTSRVVSMPSSASGSSIKTAANNEEDGRHNDVSTDRRSFFNQAALVAGAFAGIGTMAPRPASAKIYLDPALYGDQELRQSAVNSLKESVRRAILQNPGLAPSFYQLALLDGLSYDIGTGNYGPDGRVIGAVINSKDTSEYMTNLKKACDVLLESCRNLKKLTSITTGDAVALGGAAAVESIGGPFLSVQLGRLEPANKKDTSPLDLTILSGKASSAEVTKAFLKAGLTEREMTALLGVLCTIDTVRKTRTSDDWKASARPKFREAGKMGRASEFKPLTEQDIAEMEDEEFEDRDEGWYIADSFGTRDQAFGAKVADELSEKNFNKFVKELYESGKKGGSIDKFGWTTAILLDKQSPVTQSWLQKYAGSYLSFNKDVSVAYNAITQLGADYTGGKYDALLKNRKRKTLNDFD